MAMQQAAPAPAELYPVGTDVINVYVRNDGDWTANKQINAEGEVVSGTRYVGEQFIPVDPSYTLQKSGHRMETSAWYDVDMVFISTFRENNTTVKALDIPANARYMRVAAYNSSVADALTITRTA